MSLLAQSVEDAQKQEMDCSSLPRSTVISAAPTESEFISASKPRVTQNKHGKEILK